MTDEKIDAKRLAEAMQLAWNEYCDDTGHHPSDIVQRTKTGVPVVRGVQLVAEFVEHGPFVSGAASWYEVLGKGDKVTVCEQHAANRRRASHLQVSQQRLLNDWAVALSAAFLGEVPYQVGSSITGPGWRDVDVRIILADDAHAALVRLLDVDRLNLAVSLWGQIVTCLPVDFQIQQVTDASARFDSGPRLALGLR